MNPNFSPSHLISCFGKKNDRVKTPKWLYEALDSVYHFDHDPCPETGPPPDGLKSEWGQSNFVNPPFSEIKKWLKKGYKEFQKGKQVVFLITSRVNSVYWREYVWNKATDIWFLGGYITFADFKSHLPVPISVVVYRPGDPPLFFETGEIRGDPGLKFPGCHPFVRLGYSPFPE